ncbi:amino acid/amide ABC transporter ATP-binding protein 1, haat family [Halorubrum saccharovorum DSM 1137]|uniref:Probable branched-chain amino acid transport ATP-binding protein LivG n=1 Tax=Halorubrum saccharovorum DSM 1137 TaxID=1227484 RepID=M0E6N6_9EURY|nr:ABC transporter ATP-binding protein [Halorubrum saccharovorum]ELZ42592.1 amino acid/amide ABC transporter ATP-binding protein 1, haat family [Halorubrum saccharovorum DSM 1137]
MSETDESTASDSTPVEGAATDEEPSSAADDAAPAESSSDADLTELVEDDPETHTGDDGARYAPLEVEGLRKEFGGIVAVDDVSFDVEEGTLTGLIGPNGAGKSTTFNLITGMLDPDEGTVRFNGEDITGFEPHEIANQGLARTFQIARELEEMTVLENMMLAPKGQVGESLWRSILPITRGSVREQETEQLERVWEVLDFFEIDHLADEYAGNLSGGQRKLLEMARALLTDPDVLLLDEPFAGVNPSLEKRLLEHIHELRERGYTFLIVEHDMDLIMNNCERVIVMHQGRILKDGTPTEIKESEEVIEAYLGGEV